MTSSKLSPTLFTAFKQYKKDTARLATWLGDTATSLGYDFGSTAPPTPEKAQAPPPSATRPPPAKLAPRAKGQPRKQQRKPSTAAQSSSPTVEQSTAPAKPQVIDLDSDVPTTIMTTTQFIDLARYIVGANPPITVPSRVIDWACRAVMARRECAEWFRTPSPSEVPNIDGEVGEAVEQSNRQHAHFIGVLEQVVDILAVRIGYPQGGGTQVKSPQQQQQQQQQPRPAMTGVELLESRYAALALEADQQGHAAQTDDGDDNADWDVVDAAVKEALASNNTTSSATTSSGRRRKFQVKCDEDIEQEFFERYMWLIDDVNESREVVAETWSLYLAGLEDLETASLTTMIALDNIQVTYDRLVDKYPDLMANHIKYARIALRQACARNGWSSEVDQNGDYRDVQVWHETRSVLLPQLDAVKPLHKDIFAGSKQLRQRKVPGGKWTPEIQRIAWRESLASFYNGLEQLESLDVDMSVVPTYAYDALKSFRTLSLNKPIPLLPLIFIDMHLAIIHELQAFRPHKYTDRIWADVHAANRFHIASLNHFFANLPPKSSPMAQAKPENHIPKLRRDYFFWITDKETFNDAKWTRARSLAYTMFAHSPLLAGLLVARTRIDMLMFSIAMADLWQSVLYGAFVHEALRLKGASASDGWGRDSWPLMRQFIDLYGAEGIFFGREPDSMRSLWTSMNLAFGTLTFKDLQAWQESSRSSARVPLMKFRGMAPPKASRGNNAGNKRKGGSRGGAAGTSHGRSGPSGGCDDEIKRVVKVEKILASPGPVGYSGIAATLHSSGVIMDRFFTRNDPQPTKKDRNFYWGVVNSAVINGMYRHGVSPPPGRCRRFLLPAEFLRELRFQLGRDFMPVVKHDLMRLHVQSVKVLKMLREEIVEKDRLSVLISRCSDCRRRDDFLPVTVWNLIRALGADEGTGQPLGPIHAARERKEGLAILAEVKEFVAGLEHRGGAAENIQFSSTDQV